MAVYPTASVALQGVGVTRGDTILFTDLSLEIKSGDVVWIQGDNGIGKTTLLRMATGLSTPDEGDVSWHMDGHPCQPSKLIAYQGHRDAFKPSLTAREELRFWAKTYSYTNDLNDIFERVSLSDKRTLQTRNLSAGQRRRLAIARLLVSQKPIWIMDEPVAAMDKAGRELIYDIVQSHAEKGGAVMVASHESAAQLGPHTRRLHLSAQEQGTR